MSLTRQRYTIVARRDWLGAAATMVGPPTVCLPALQCKTSKANLNVFYSREVSAIQDNRRKDSVQILLWHSSLSSVQRQVRNSHTLLQCLNMPTYALLGTTGATARSINISWGSFPGSSISACTMLALILRACQLFVSVADAEDLLDYFSSTRRPFTTRMGPNARVMSSFNGEVVKVFQ